MAESQIEAIAAEEAERHGLCAVAVEHRSGTVALSEPSVIVAASAPHRGEAFAGARAIIDRVKAEAPIWKVEVTADGRRRADGTLPSTRPAARAAAGSASRATSHIPDRLGAKLPRASSLTRWRLC